MISGGIFDVAHKQSSLEDINNRLSDESTWSNLELSQSLNKEKADLEKFLNSFLSVDEAINDNLDFLDIAIEESDDGSIEEINEETQALTPKVEDLEFNRMFSNKMDPNSAFIDIQSGSGGTEAQDWADMLLRMYTRWAEKHEFSVSVIEHSPGEVAGIKSASLLIKGSMHMDGLEQKLVFIGWLGNLLSILAVDDIHPLHLYLFLQKLMNLLKFN